MQCRAAEPLHQLRQPALRGVRQGLCAADARLQPFRQRGLASWYGRRFHGQKTSSGERYDMYAMTAAHPTLPIPSYARVTNLAERPQRRGAHQRPRAVPSRARVIDLSRTSQRAHEARLHRRPDAGAARRRSKPCVSRALGPAGRISSRGACSRPSAEARSMRRVFDLASRGSFLAGFAFARRRGGAAAAVSGRQAPGSSATSRAARSSPRRRPTSASSPRRSPSS